MPKNLTVAEKSAMSTFNVFGGFPSVIFSSTTAPAEGWGPSLRHAMAMQANAESLGFSFTLESLRLLSSLSVQELREAFGFINKALTKKKGAHRVFQPLFPNFPEQVCDMEEAELMAAAAEHYAGDLIGVRVIPSFQTNPRRESIMQVKPTPVGFLDEAAVTALFHKTVTSPNGFTPIMREALVERFDLLAQNGTLKDFLASVRGLVPSRENRAFLSGLAFKHGLLRESLHDGFVVTDALRLCAALSDGDTSLGEAARIPKMSRSVRRVMMDFIEGACSSDATQALENMFERRENFLRLGERVHAGEFKKSHPLAFTAFSDLRAGNKPESVMSAVERACKEKRVPDAISLLKSRPGVLVRNLTLLANRGAGGDALASAVSQCGHSVATPVLLQASRRMRDIQRVQNSGVVPSTRTFLPKGGLGNLYFEPEVKYSTLLSTEAGAIADAAEAVLEERFAALPPLGKVWIDPAMERCFVPFATRTASKSIKTLSKGSRLPLQGSSKIVRLFVWWNQNGLDSKGNPLTVGRTDIDLSAFLMDDAFEYAGHCDFTSLTYGRGARSGRPAFVHSGDFTSAPNGACEFIDIDIERMKETTNGTKVAVVLNSYSGQKYADLPECYVGWMELDNPDEGRVFDARKVVQRADVCANSTAVLPLIFDVNSREVVWVDSPFKGNTWGGMVSRQKGALQRMSKGICSISRPSMTDLMLLHVAARGGEIVEKREDADLTVSFDGDVTPYDVERLSSEWMSSDHPAPAQRRKPAKK